jgi:hypothetical protein
MALQDETAHGKDKAEAVLMNDVSQMRSPDADDAPLPGSPRWPAMEHSPDQGVPKSVIW